MYGSRKVEALDRALGGAWAADPPPPYGEQLLVCLIASCILAAVVAFWCR